MMEKKKPKASLMCCCSLKIIAKIKQRLNKNNLKIFADSCFGHLLEIESTSLGSQRSLLLLLLQHLDSPSSTNTTLTFNIHNSTIKFSPTDFESITGLPLGASSRAKTPTSSALHRDVFGSSRAIMLTDVEEAFLDVSDKHGGGGEETLKLALLYLLFGVVLPASHRKKVELRYLHLADDLRAFLAFPWGRIGHEFLVSSVRSVRLRLDDKRAARLIMPGFVFALQVWIYEIMPSLATRCATRVRELEGSTPRVLGWSCKKRIGYSHFKKFFTLGVGGGDDEVLSGKASPEQQNVKVEPLTSTSFPQEERRQRRSEDDEVEGEEDVEEATSARRGRLSRNHVSTNKSRSSMAEIERNRALLALAFDDSSAQDTPQPWKTCHKFEISEAEYARSKALYEMLLDRTKRLKLWISFAQFEAFAVIEELGISDKRTCLDRGRGVFERALSYFRSCAPKLKEERALVLKEWLDMEYRFAEVGDVGSVRAKLPQKLKRRRRVETEDGSARYEDYIDYLFPEDEDVKVLKKHKATAGSH